VTAARYTRFLPSPDDLKYAPGVGARIPLSQRPLRPLEWIVLLHVGIFLVWTTWGFGGAAEWMRPLFAWWGSIGLLFTLTAVQDREARREGRLRPLLWLGPLAAFNALVIAGCLNPSFIEVQYGAETLLVNSGGRPWLPSSARPGLALNALWLFDAIWISCYNLALVIRQRRALRGLLLVAATNAFVLAVFGTIQKLSGATGLYFGTVESPQKFFFASFVYHNHWGAFVVLMLATCLGLAWHFGRRRESRDFFHSPVFGGMVVMLFLAATVPLSTSRSCTLLVVVLLSATFLHWIAQLARRRRQFKESIALPLAGAVLAIALAGTGVWFVARESIVARIAKTREQLDDMRERGSVGSRGVLYHDTWRMAKDKLWFGWGMASYPYVFTLYNSQKSIDRLPVFYRDAHSDWLQSAAEHGLVGSALLALCAMVPLFRVRRHLGSALSSYLLGGCGLLLLYAGVEFPFGNVAVVLSWWMCFFCAVQYGRLHDREGPTAITPGPAGPPPAPPPGAPA